MNRLLSVLALAVCGTGLAARAANPGDEVVIVYNTRVPESKTVADYYAARRLVPTDQIFGFALSTNEDMSRMEFRDALQKPLAQAVKKRKLWQIGQTIIPATTSAQIKQKRHSMESKVTIKDMEENVRRSDEEKARQREAAKAKEQP